MGIAAKFNPEFIQAEHFAEPLSPEQVCAAFIERDDVFIVNPWQDPFLFAPNAGTVRPLVGFIAIIKQSLPIFGIAASKGFEIVLHFKERAALRAAIDDRIKRIDLSTFLVEALKPSFISSGHLS
jgi:hypothetical protein